MHATENILGKKAFLMTWNGSMVGYLNGIFAQGGGNLKTNFSKIQMPGVLPGKGIEASIWPVQYYLAKFL